MVRARLAHRLTSGHMKAFLLAALVAPVALATTLLKADVATLTRGSSAVVVGKVVGSSSRFTEDKARIITDTEIAVTQTIKGEVPARVTVMQPGGEVGDVGQKVAGTARFSDGEEVVLFLEKRGARFFVTGLAQGKFTVQRSSDGKSAWALPPAGLDAELIDPVTRQPTRPDGKPVLLETLIAQIATAAGQRAPEPGSPTKLELRP